MEPMSRVIVFDETSNGSVVIVELFESDVNGSIADSFIARSFESYSLNNNKQSKERNERIHSCSTKSKKKSNPITVLVAIGNQSCIR
jgi:hypothetical protein